MEPGDASNHGFVKERACFDLVGPARGKVPIRIVIAALDETAAARPVLETALRMGELTGAAVEAVHVSEGPQVTPEWLAERSEVPFHVLKGQVVQALLTAIEEPQVIAAVLGARAPTGGRRPVGRTTMRVLQSAGKPVVVVPPEVVAPSALKRLLIPLEGTEASSRAMLEGLSPLLGSKVELVVLHVFTEDTFPPMLNHGGYDLETLGEEFITRHIAKLRSLHVTHIELRTGHVGTKVTEVTGGQVVDLVVLSWSQDSSAGHALVVHDVLGTSVVPVLIIPIENLPTVNRHEDLESVRSS